MHTSNIIQTEQIIFKKIHVHMYTYMHVTINEKEVMNLQEITGLYESV